MFSFLEIQGDLFTACPTTIPLAHCVSLDFRMSQGIALTFRQKYGQIPCLKAQIKEVGGCAVLQQESRLLFYMVSKRRYYMKPSYYTLEMALLSLKRHILELGVEQLAIPGYLSSCRDRLDWQRVKQLIHNVFADTNITIYAYYF